MNDRGKRRTMREVIVIACILLAGPAGAQDIFEVLKNAPGGFNVLKDVPTEFRGRWCLYGKSVAKEMSELFDRPLLDVTYKPCTPGTRPHENLFRLPDGQRRREPFLPAMWPAPGRRPAA